MFATQLAQEWQLYFQLEKHKRNKKSTTCVILETGSHSVGKATPTARDKNVSIPNALYNFSYRINKLLH